MDTPPPTLPEEFPWFEQNENTNELALLPEFQPTLPEEFPLFEQDPEFQLILSNLSSSFEPLLPSVELPDVTIPSTDNVDDQREYTSERTSTCPPEFQLYKDAREPETESAPVSSRMHNAPPVPEPIFQINESRICGRTDCNNMGIYHYAGNNVYFCDYHRLEGMTQVQVVTNINNYWKIPQQVRAAGQLHSRSINGYEFIHDIFNRSINIPCKARTILGKCPTTEALVALKMYDLDQLQDRPQKLQFVCKEVKAMASLEHQNIVRLIAHDFNADYPKKDGSTKKVVLLVMEYAAGGTVLDLIQHKPFSEKVARTLFSSLLGALDCCHEAGISHRDLQPAHLLLDANYQLKLAGFGHAAISIQGTGPSQTRYCGSPNCMAPEVQDTSLRHEGRYEGSKADIWSAGVLLFWMMVGRPPYVIGCEQDDIFTHIHSCPGLSDTFQDLLIRIFVVNPEERASLQQIRVHHWMHGDILSEEELCQELRALKDQKNQLNDQQGYTTFRTKRARTQQNSPLENLFSSETTRSTTRITSLCVSLSLPEFLVGADVLYSPDTAEDLFTDIQSACAEMNARISMPKQNKQKLKFQAEFQHSCESGLSVEVAFKVYTIFIQETDLSVLHLQYRGGDLYEYQKIYKVFAARFSQLSRKSVNQIDLLP